MKNNIEYIEQKIDLSIPRRRYCSKKCDLTTCPECNSTLTEEGCTIILVVKSDTDEGEFMTNLTGSHFCNNCPVVTFDTEKIEQAAKLGIRGDKNLSYLIAGIVNLNSIPKEKKHLEIGIDENPIPLVHFLPDLDTTTFRSDKKIGRNEPCPCGSGKKYKKCCVR
jgi:hypothetical protein